MAFKSTSIIMAPDSDPTKHGSFVKTPKADLTSVMVEFMNFHQAVEVCSELVREEGIQWIML